MKCSDDILLHALLLITFARGLGSTKLYLGNIVYRFIPLVPFEFIIYGLVPALFHRRCPRIRSATLSTVVHIDESRYGTDEVIDDVIEKLFGSAVQDEFAELTLNCPDALMALKVVKFSINDLLY